MSKREEFLNRCVGIDFETSGLDYDTAEIIEQGVAIYNGKWEVALSRLHNCRGKIPAEASAVNNITADLVKDEPFFDQRNFAKNLIRDDSILISHNAPFDSGMVKKYLDPDYYESLTKDWLCTLRMMRRLYVNDTSCEQFTLPYLRYRFNLTVDIDTDAHRAGFDAYMAGVLLEYVIDQLEERNLIHPDFDYLEQIKEWSAQPVLYEFMPIGKYKGMKFSEIPMSYYEWAVFGMDKLNPENPSYDPDLAETIAYVMDKRL